MTRYAADYDAFDRWGAASFRPRYSGDYPRRGAPGAPGAPGFYVEPQRGWSPAYEGWGYGRERSPRRGRALPRQRGRETGQPWGGTSEVDRIRAAELMTPNPATVTPATSLADVARRMRDLDVGVIPVVSDEEGARLEGVITDRDIVVRAAAEGKDLSKAKASEFMSRDVEAVHDGDHVREVFSVMKRNQVRRVPVTDEDGRLVGIIAQADLAVSYAGLDLERETEVEEVVERISEPARPQWRGRGPGPAPRRGYGGYDADLGDRLRAGWRFLRREARELLDRGYDRDWR